MRTAILSISGSDSLGQTGIQADLQTITAMGGFAVTVITCVGSTSLQPPPAEGGFSLPASVVTSQVSALMQSVRPKAVKIGLVRDIETIRSLRSEVLSCRRLVLAPGIFDAEGKQMISDEAIAAIGSYLLPESLLLMLRCRDAEKMLGMTIQTDDDMQLAARQLRAMGAAWVMLRGGQHAKGRLKALLCGPVPADVERSKKRSVSRLRDFVVSDGAICQFFTSYNTDGWQRHGVASALSAAITVRLGMGDDVPSAVRNAHSFIHSQVVYAKEATDRNFRSIDIYNSFVGLIAQHYTDSHDVCYYADRLCISPRYLSAVTDRVVGKPPKQIITDYVINEARSYLSGTRLSIQQVSLKLGFLSQAQFCRYFHKEQGVSPSDFRHQR